MSSADEYEQQNYWKQLANYQLAYNIVSEQITQLLIEEAGKLKSSVTAFDKLTLEQIQKRLNELNGK